MQLISRSPLLKLVFVQNEIDTVVVQVEKVSAVHIAIETRKAMVDLRFRCVNPQRADAQKGLLAPPPPPPSKMKRKTYDSRDSPI